MTIIVLKIIELCLLALIGLKGAIQQCDWTLDLYKEEESK